MPLNDTTQLGFKNKLYWTKRKLAHLTWFSGIIINEERSTQVSEWTDQIKPIWYLLLSKFQKYLSRIRLILDNRPSFKICSKNHASACTDSSFSGTDPRWVHPCCPCAEVALQTTKEGRHRLLRHHSTEIWLFKNPIVSWANTLILSMCGLMTPSSWRSRMWTWVRCWAFVGNAKSLKHL